MLSVRKVWNGGPGKATVYATHCDRRQLAYNDTPRDLQWPEATVSTGRPMAALAKDITRRVVEPAAEVNARFVGLLAARNERCRSLGLAMADLATSFPSLKVSRKDCDAHSADLHLYEGGLYLTGTLRPGGEVSVERLGSLSAERSTPRDGGPDEAAPAYRLTSPQGRNLEAPPGASTVAV